MNWIKFSDRMPWIGQKIILQTNYRTTKCVHKVDKLLYIELQGLGEAMRWKPYTEKKPKAKCDVAYATYNHFQHKVMEFMLEKINPIDVASIDLGPKYHRCNAIEPMDNSVVFCDEVEWR